MARNLTVQDIAKRWQTAAEGNGPTNYEQGVRAVTDNPMAAAAAQVDYWAARTAAAKDKFAARLANKPIDQWKGPALGKGKNRYAEGIRTGATKYVAFQTVFKPFQDGVTAETRAMPKMTEGDRDRRALNQIQKTRGFKYTG